MKEKLLLSYKHSIISYRKFGSGPGRIVCLHGYGEEAGSFEFLDKYAGNQYTFYAIDLPFHGETKWNEGLDCSHSELLEIIGQIVGTNQKIILLGFSMGGRIALSLYQAVPAQIEKLVLLAPDGLKVNFWYWLVTQTYIGKRLFSFTMKYPGWFFVILKLLNKIKLINPSIFKFVSFYIGDAEVRKQLYTRWITLRKLKPNLENIKGLTRKYNTPVRLVYGKHDRIILSSVGEKFRKGIEGYCTLSIIQSGHQVLHEKHAGDIVENIVY